MRKRMLDLARRKLLVASARRGSLHRTYREHESVFSEPADPGDSVDHASGQRAVSLLERLDEAELRDLRAVESALQRLEAGTYGRCLSCGFGIDDARLRTLPETPYCVECAADSERHARLWAESSH